MCQWGGNNKICVKYLAQFLIFLVKDILYMGPYKQNGSSYYFPTSHLLLHNFIVRATSSLLDPQTLKNFDFKDKTQQPGRKDANIKEMAKKLEMTVTPDRVSTQ